jgi:hypothetical protein
LSKAGGDGTTVTAEAVSDQPARRVVTSNTGRRDISEVDSKNKGF